MIIPVGPVKLDSSVTREQAKFLLKKFPGALLVRTGKGFISDDASSEWYAVVCDRFVEVEELSSNTRSKVRRGGKNCLVKKVDAELIARKGYSVFCSAFERYKGTSRPRISTSEYERKIMVTKDFHDIVDYWGIFRQGELAGYSVNYLYGTVEANYSVVKFHPEFLKYYTTYSLIQRMNRYYLKEKSFEYVNDGFRSLLHQTGIQELLQEKFAFRKAQVKLGVVYRPLVEACLAVGFPVRALLGALNPKIAALFELEEIRRKE
jgi:hypothetical protein